MREMLKKLWDLLIGDEEKQEKSELQIEELEKRVAPTANGQVGWGC